MLHAQSRAAGIGQSERSVNSNGEKDTLKRELQQGKDTLKRELQRGPEESREKGKVHGAGAVVSVSGPRLSYGCRLGLGILLLPLRPRLRLRLGL